ncbi:MAG: hypothetical protein QXT26_05580 [Thermoproteota archaeon]
MLREKYLTEGDVRRTFCVQDLTVIDYWLQEGVDYIVDGNTKIYTASAVERLKKFWRWVDERVVEGQVNLGEGEEERPTEKYRKAISEIIQKFCSGEVGSLGRMVQERVRTMERNQEFFRQIVSTVYHIENENMFTVDSILSSLVYYKYLVSKMAKKMISSFQEIRVKPLEFLTEWISLAEIYSLSKAFPHLFKRYLCRMLIFIDTDEVAISINGFTKYKISPSAYFRADLAFTLLQFYHGYWIPAMMKTGYKLFRLVKLIDNPPLRYLCVLHKKVHGLNFRGMLLCQDYVQSEKLNRKWQK